VAYCLLTGPAGQPVRFWLPEPDPDPAPSWPVAVAGREGLVQVAGLRAHPQSWQGHQRLIHDRVWPCCAFWLCCALLGTSIRALCYECKGKYDSDGALSQASSAPA